jgi:hypothetical protein
MPRDPQGRKRPADVISNAVQVMRIATGQIEVVPDANRRSKNGPKKSKNPAAVALGRRGGIKGGKARAKSLTPEKRSEIAKRAAKARWDKSS